MQSTNNNIKAEIIGGAGYTAGELLRILLQHPYCSVEVVNSTSHEGTYVTHVHEDLFGETELKFSNSTNHTADVVFLCQGHGQSRNVLDQHQFAAHTKIIDLSNDFRLADTNEFVGRQFVYGLPELNHGEISQTDNIANPGCFATAIQLALLPLASAGALTEDIHVHAVTGSTGAGQRLTETSHFSWRNNNLSVYKAFEHQHLDEIKEGLASLQSDFKGDINFIPLRGDFTRGILATAYFNTTMSHEELLEVYGAFYNDAPFVHVNRNGVHLKQVVNSNKCMLNVEKKNDKALITSVIDNLVKGASGQAVQNMNLMFGLPEMAGLGLKAVAF